MRLTRYTDYSLRVLMHLALHRDSLVSIGEITRTYDLSHNHLMKVVNALARHGFVETVRGRGGGMRLARDPRLISVGEVVRHSEEGFQLADCSSCKMGRTCGLKGVFAEGVAAMLNVFDAYSIADLSVDRSAIQRLIRGEAPLSTDGDSYA